MSEIDKSDVEKEEDDEEEENNDWFHCTVYTVHTHS